jgi:hypothetical protein
MDPGRIFSLWVGVGAARRCSSKLMFIQLTTIFTQHSIVSVVKVSKAIPVTVGEGP